MDATALCSAFTRELADQLAGESVADLNAKAGLHESIVQEITTGNSQDLFSWEIASACAAAAELPQEAIVRLRDLWVKAESAGWAECRPELLRGIEQETEQARRQRPYDDKALCRRLFSEYRPSVPWRKTPGSGQAHGKLQFEPWSCTQLRNDQRIPDPNRAMSLSEFYELLRQLHVWVGRPSYAEIEQRSWGALSRTTAGSVLAPPRSLQRQVQDHDKVRYLTTVFGLPQAEVERWIKAYNRVRELRSNPVPHVVRQEAITGRPHGTVELSLDSLASTEPRLEQSLGTRSLPSLEPSQAAQVAKHMAQLRRWRVAALSFAASTAGLGIAIALMVGTENSPSAQNFQFSEKLQLFPGKPVHIPLKLSTGDWSLALHFRLESTEVASACVNDAQLSYVVEKTNGGYIASGRIPKVRVTRGPRQSGSTEWENWNRHR